MTRLCNDTLDRVFPCDRPAYDRNAVRCGIVHIGIGAFHRGHMAVYIDDLLARDPAWGIRGASLRRPDTRDALAPQDYLYSVNVRDGGGTESRIVGAVMDIIDASGGSAGLIAALADDAVRIVSLTVTEKGYCHTPGTGRLAEHHPDVVHDLGGAHPRSVPGILVAAAALRRERGLGGLTVLSCDNLSGNGAIARAVVLDMARRLDPPLADWIAAHFTFPATMVDRIVPALGDGDRAQVAAALGMTDQWPILTEPFSQWVIEDDFAAGRPDFASVGVQMVADVAPYETAKLRMLNGSHSALAYLGQLAGHDLVSEAVGDAAIRQFITQLMTTEVIPTLDPAGQDLHAYRDALLARFANPALHHRLAQIGTDGSQKLPQRVLAPMRERLARDEPIGLLTLTLAAWMAYVQRVQMPADPMGEVLAAAARAPGSLVDNLLAIPEVFDPALAADARVTDPLRRHLVCLQAEGVHAAIARCTK